MKLAEVIAVLQLQVRSGGEQTDHLISGCYAGDLLSDVIGNASEDQVWITRQVHQNIVAVAVLKNLAGIIIVMGAEPCDDTLQKAAEEQVPIMVASQSAFEVAGKLYELLKKGDAKI
jgi:predicted transcriptional regulator